MTTKILDHFESLTLMEKTLEQAEEKAISQTEMEFVDSLQNKLRQYGENCFLSESQYEWLMKIAER